VTANAGQENAGLENDGKSVGLENAGLQGAVCSCRRITGFNSSRLAAENKNLARRRLVLPSLE